jgi:hypothetical protein
MQVEKYWKSHVMETMSDLGEHNEERIGSASEGESDEDNDSGIDDYAQEEYLEASGRLSARFPRVTRTLINDDRAKAKKEAVWVARREKKRLNQIAKNEEKKEMLENIKKVNQRQAGVDSKKRAMEFEKIRRQSVATAAPHRKTEQEKRKELLHDSIMNCTTCRMSMTYCPKCRIEVEAFFDSFPALAEKYQVRANEIFKRIKRALDDKHYMIGSESDDLVSTKDILEVTRYLKKEDERTRRWLQRRGRAFRAREKYFKEKLLESDVYHDINVNEHSDGINMFGDKKVVDPVFEDNIITRYATTNAISELYIKEEMQHPWSGGGDVKQRIAREHPKLRIAGKTVWGTGVYGFEEVYNG